MINLIGSIMQNGKTPFFISDIPVRLSKQWVDEVYETFIQVLPLLLAPASKVTSSAIENASFLNFL